MAGKITVTFRYVPGLGRDIFENVRLGGSWDATGRFADQWTFSKMEKTAGADRCPEFKGTVFFDPSQAGVNFRWGVKLDGPGGKDLWGIATETGDGGKAGLYRSFTLVDGGREEVYHLTYCHRFGAQRQGDGIRFSVWAPHARSVDVVFGNPKNGYIDDQGGGIASNPPPVKMVSRPGGVWESPILAPFSTYDHIPYMFRVTRKQGGAVYRTDLYSRCQIGSGDTDPEGKPYSGKPSGLAGPQSCSVAVDPVTVVKKFEDADKLQTTFIPEKEFWAAEFSPSGPRPPKRLGDMVIYELHVGSLGYGNENSGTFDDMMPFIDYLAGLGVNAVEFLPMSEFNGTVSWGYGTSHYFALEFSAGGRDKLKHVIRALHSRGIAVIMDVCYNHYSPSAERAEWMYDSDANEENIYYWYEGTPANYQNDFPPDHDPAGHGGYIDNQSTGYAPRFREENVRKMFISSGAALMENFHIDGFRLDQTTSIHSYNVLHYDGRAMGNVNQSGARFLREYARTLKLINPRVILIAEDHSGWEQVVRPQADGGMGFDAVWYADFHHHLAGSNAYGAEYAKLIVEAGYGDDRPLRMDYFAGALAASNGEKIVYHESHDEAGNAQSSGRTMALAVNWAPLAGPTRGAAEERSRFAAGMTLLAGGVPMFFMGEETGAAKVYTYNDFKNHREDLYGGRKGSGARMFLFYKDIIALRMAHPGLRSPDTAIIHTHDDNRVIVFRRWGAGEDFLVLASLNNNPFPAGYHVANPALPGGRWGEIFNSDASCYGGRNIGNAGGEIASSGGSVSAVIPARGFVVLIRR